MAWRELSHFHSQPSWCGVGAAWVLGICQLWRLHLLPQGLCQRAGRAAYRLWAAWGLAPTGLGGCSEGCWNPLWSGGLGAFQGSIPEASE